MQKTTENLRTNPEKPTSDTVKPVSLKFHKLGKNPEVNTSFLADENKEIEQEIHRNQKRVFIKVRY